MAQKTPRPNEAPNVGAEEIPPGATREALNREQMPTGEPPDEEPRRGSDAPDAPSEEDINR